METFPGDCSQQGCEQPNCADESSWVFARLRVRPSIAFGTAVEWLLHPSFVDPYPHTYQLQWGHTDSPIAEDWADVGDPADNVFMLSDTEQRVFGHVQRTFYRVKLTTDVAEYISRPMHSLGDLTPREWRLALNRERLWRIQFERTIRGQAGYLIKSKVHGTKVGDLEKVTDWQTGEVIDAQNEDTFGGEFVGDYGSFYAPVCCDADLDNMARGEHLTPNRGTVNDSSKVNAIFMATPLLDSGDIWVSKNNDLRWKVWGLQHLEEMNGVPIVLRAELRLVPFSSVLYRIPVSG